MHNLFHGCFLGHSDFCSAKCSPSLSEKRFVSEAQQLTEYFAVQLSTVGYKVVPRSQLRERIGNEKEESYKACYDESCQIDLGKAVAAQKSVATKLLKVGTSCALTATLYDLRSETTEHAASVETRCGQEELFGGFKKLAQELVVR